ncbi:uncharacterized protein STEHIDRAFT_112962 [Stereum hirsutum FP-91666 SS1]|uniref:uncharacterized protein n=1 Tax=Stereum hirsutum (strain FP-91666) TaxID=721885 RepID=UPI0004449F48|nr:uncharacterized protein STEHIDRAFT_112962 [Stereum hirsutum FP-91666 SS1]EIM84633.1 hypothetical protein STEHIDRAFT_112962 [Stereum hirsutum FP-91666 SS1]
MAASSRSSQYLHDHFNERAERVNNLQAEVNRLQDENKILHIKLAEEKIKTQGLKASVKAMKLCLNSLMGTAVQRLRQMSASEDGSMTRISNEAEEEPADSSNSSTVVPTADLGIPCLALARMEAG